MTDNRTTELLKDYVFTLRRLEYDVDKPGSNMTLGEYEAEEKRVTDEYAQAIAATLGSGTCELKHASWDDGQCTWGCICSACDARFEHETGIGYNYCPNCGAKVIQGVDNAD